MASSSMSLEQHSALSAVMFCRHAVAYRLDGKGRLACDRMLSSPLAASTSCSDSAALLSKNSPTRLPSIIMARW